MSLMKMLVKAGYPEKDFSHHESDLYIYKTPLTTKVLDRWVDDNEFASSYLVSEFRDNVTGKEMYEIAFQYDPYWELRGTSKEE